MEGRRIDPWAQRIFTEELNRLREEFGIGEFPTSILDGLEPPALFRRGLIAGQRGFEPVLKRMRAGEDFYVMSGLMPSGKMHLGHKLVIDQMRFYSRFTDKIHIGVADVEAYATRGVDFKEAFRLATEEYLLNYLALGLPPDRFRIYFQSRYETVVRLAYVLGRRTNLSTASAIYGFGGTTNLTHILAPLVQAADILHPQILHGPMPGVVPVGLDQDPHMRFTRDLAQAFRLFTFQVEGDRVAIYQKGEGDYIDSLLESLKETYSVVEVNKPYRAIYLELESVKDLDELDIFLADVERSLGGLPFISPASTYHHFTRGLTGGKMSSSVPESAIFLSDSPEVAEGKVRRAITGGRVTAEEQRKKGGEPDKCAVFDLFKLHLVEDDRRLSEIREECIEGKRLCGQCKREAAEMLKVFLKELRERREGWRESEEYREMVKDLRELGEHPLTQNWAPEV
ncbi:MAG: tryptophan--tRNA ligase [Thermoplasmata archaeon]|nr:tryptophan--tRNA ligase [Thermoplasmata archaeon]